jgi:hypothetical protein
MDDDYCFHLETQALRFFGAFLFSGRSIRLLKPSTLVRYPPAKHEKRQGQSQTPPDGQSNVHDRAKNEEEQPEDFLFHQKNLTTDEHG